MWQGTIPCGSRAAAWWFTDRSQGESHPPYAHGNLAMHVGDDPATVRGNRLALETTVGLGALSWMGPVHGVDIATLDEPHVVTPNVDALATRVAGLPLATLAADCVPLLLVAGDVVLAAHVGWRGFADGMTDQLVHHLAAAGIDPARAQVLLGPAICGACYGVPEDRAEMVAEVCAPAVVSAANGGPGVDVRRGLQVQWEALGATVEVVGPCTFETPSLFSHRRDGVTGRQAGVIAWMP